LSEVIGVLNSRNAILDSIEDVGGNRQRVTSVADSTDLVGVAAEIGALDATASVDTEDSV
jgi:hypothetical protein